MPISQLLAIVTAAPHSRIGNGSRAMPNSTPATATTIAQPTNCHLRCTRSANSIAPIAPSGVVNAITIV
jgi:hypothetical protein